ncbi:MAG: shikimate dehydrogenase [Fimbriimonas sp.]|nr:shikimate dehydrogenase [Fimbriimonas sp.]
MTFPWREAPEAEFAVIGHPVNHTKSPRMHSAAYYALGLPYRYVAIDVPVGEVDVALEHLRSVGYRGVNVTVPHKEDALAWSVDVEPLAARVRAANTIRLADRACINTDAPGFLDTLEGFDLGPKRALLLGAGGSARALAVALSGTGYELTLYNRTFDKAIQLAKELDLSEESVLRSADPQGASLILNTTSASLNGAQLPILWERAEPGALAYDLMYAKEPTPFLACASEHGLQTMDGLKMLVAQGARSFEWWLGTAAPREAMLEAIR